MLSFKTRYTSVELGETVKISRKGKNSLVESFKVTKVEVLGFNEMEGWNYLLNVSVKTQEGYKNKRLKMVTNSSYIEDFVWDNDESRETNFQNWLDEMVGV